MSQNLVGFGSPDGLGSSCGCASRSVGMAGFGAGPDGLGDGPSGGTVASNLIKAAAPVALLTGVVAGVVASGVGYAAGGPVGKKLSGKSPVMVGAASGAIVGGIAAVLYVLQGFKSASKTSTGT